jgi:hypothetical protein
LLILKNWKKCSRRGFIKDLIFSKRLYWEGSKTISRIWVEELGFGVSNHNYWDEMLTSTMKNECS